MDTVMQLVKGEMVNIQTGRAKPAMVEDVKVEAYEGTWLTLKEVAGITAPDPSTLLIKPWDSSILEKNCQRDSAVGFARKSNSR